MSRRPLLSLAGLLVTLSSLLVAQDPPAQKRPQGRPGGMPGGTGEVVLLADRDRDGAVTAEEWRTFADGLQAPDGAIDGDRLKTRLVLSLLDTDRDGSTTREEIAVVFGALDRDGDGTVAGEERDAMAGRGRGGQGGGNFGRGVAVVGADADRDGTTTRAEWDTMLGGLPVAGETVTTDHLIAVVRKAQTAGPSAGDRPGAFTPGVYLLTVERSVDADQDGILTRADLDRVFADLDRNQDGSLEAAELRAPRAGAGGAGRGGPRAGGGGENDAERRDLPPAMPWQRNLADALLLAAQTGKPLLICVNMDGESASESLAWGRYRDPAFAEWARGFICVVASPDRRSPRDHDDRGRRLSEARFGRIVNSEHIDIEPQLFERYFRGTRVAPRHVGIAPDGTILFDISLTQSLGPVDTALQKHGRPEPRLPDAASLSEAELLASADAGHRDHLESRFCAADEPTRLRLATAALSSTRPVQHPEILRMALLDPSAAVRRSAVAALGHHTEKAPLGLVPAALTAADAAGGELLAKGLAARAAADPQDLRARHLARVAAGLLAPSAVVDVAKFGALSAVGTAAGEPSPAELDDLETRMMELEGAIKSSPDDGNLRLRLAAATLRFGRIRQQQGGDPTFLLQDAHRAAVLALEHGAARGPALGHLAWASYLLSDLDDALVRAEAALPLLAEDGGAPLVAQVLEVFAQCRTRALYAAMEKGDGWPASWVADLQAAHRALLSHPAATETQAVAALEWSEAIEAYALQKGIVEGGLRRWPASGTLHTWLRWQVLRDHGADALVERYRSGPGPGVAVDPATWDWFAGVARLAAAERCTQNRQPAAALVAYRSAVADLGRARGANAAFADSALHYESLALAGAARVLAEGGDLAAAVEATLRSLQARPASATSTDGLGHTPADNAAFVRQAVNRAGDADAAGRIAEAAARLGVNLPAPAGRSR